MKVTDLYDTPSPAHPAPTGLDRQETVIQIETAMILPALFQIQIHSEVAIEFDMLTISRGIIKETSQNIRLSKMKGFYSFRVHNNKSGPQVKKTLVAS